MSTLPPKETAVTKVLATACTWAGHRKTVQCAPAEEKARAAGRYKESGKQLAQAVEMYERSVRNPGEGA